MGCLWFSLVRSEVTSGGSSFSFHNVGCHGYVLAEGIVVVTMEQGTLISHPIGEESRPIKWIGAEEKPCYSECWFQLPNHWNFHYLSTKVGEKMVKVARGILPNPTVLLCVYLLL